MWIIADSGPKRAAVAGITDTDPSRSSGRLVLKKEEFWTCKRTNYGPVLITTMHKHCDVVERKKKHYWHPFPYQMYEFGSLRLCLPRSVRGSWPPWCVRSAHRDTPGEDARRPRRRCWSVCPPRPLRGVPSRRWSTRSPDSPRHTHRCRPVAAVGGPPRHLQLLLKDQQSHDANIILKTNESWWPFW